MLEIAAPEVGQVVSGRKKLKTFANVVGTKKMGVGEKKNKQRTVRTRSISRQSRSKNSGSRKDIFDNIK